MEDSGDEQLGEHLETQNGSGFQGGYLNLQSANCQRLAYSMLENMMRGLLHILIYNCREQEANFEMSHTKLDLRMREKRQTARKLYFRLARRCLKKLSMEVPQHLSLGTRKQRCYDENDRKSI